MGLPGVWTVLLLRAVVVHPAGCSLSPPYCGETAIAFEEFDPLGTRDDVVFVAAFPTAHTLARLRIAGRVTAPVARLATGWAGLPFAGRGSHPLDDKPNWPREGPEETNFMKSSPPHSLRTSLPGRTGCPARTEPSRGLGTTVQTVLGPAGEGIVCAVDEDGVSATHLGVGHKSHVDREGLRSRLLH